MDQTVDQFRRLGNVAQLVFGVMLVATPATLHAQNLQAAVAQSKKTGKPLFVMGSTDS